MTTGPWMSRREAVALGPAALLALGGCGSRSAAEPTDEVAGKAWTRLTAAAPFPGAYGFPVRVARDGRFIALHPRGTWASRDGIVWARTPLPMDGVNHAYRPLISHAGATWTLGRFAGNYETFTLDRLVRRTADYRRWEIVGETDAPPTIFPALIGFGDSLWQLGGIVNGRTVNAVWRSRDGVRWDRQPDPPWGRRARARCFVFHDRLWLIGGGEIDGPTVNDIWSSHDGAIWRREATRLADPEPFGFTPQVFAGRIWLVGANRAGDFGSAMLVSRDGRDWRAVNAPWSPRGYPAVWTDGGRMYVTGGKFSRPGPGGESAFVYSNDVWAMTA